MATKIAPQSNGNGQVISEARASKAVKAPAGAASEAKIGAPIVLPRLDIRAIKLRLIGDSPLITHRWSEKARKQMLDKQMGKASAGKEAKDPEADYRESLYVLEAREPFEDSTFGFPTVGFKAAAVTACTSLGKSITKVAARQAFHVVGEYAVIEGRPQMREDMVRIAMSTADIRYRGEFVEWATELTIQFNARVLSDEQVANLFNTAGFAVGVGEWRPEKDGPYGRFHVG